MGKILMVGVTNTSYVVCWSLFSGLLLNLGSLPTLAIDADLVTRRIAQAAPSTSVNRPILRMGSEGTAVSELQAALKLLGYYTDVVDGVYRESTAIAVSRFQQASGLNADGITGPTTWDRLFPSRSASRRSSSSSSNPSSSKNPASSFPVPSTLQTTTRDGREANPLRDRNRPTAINVPVAANPQSTAVALPILREGMQGPAVTQLQERLKTLGFFTGAVDGVFGAATQAAVKAAQQNFKIQPDGVVGPSTWNALLR